MKKIRVAVLFGGTNTEHEVSLVSGRSVISHLNQQKYDVLPVLITKDNKWFLHENVVNPLDLPHTYDVDIIFPVLHGPYGEDGTIQGLIELMHVPYIGCGVLASALCMDKAIQKQLCAGAGLPVPGYHVVTSPHHLPKVDSYPVFVKPANQGSSIGVMKVNHQEELLTATTQAFKFDTKVLVETAIPHAREIECAVLGPSNHPEVSIVGEIIPSNEFYDYDAKYIDGQSQAVIPAKLPQEIARRIQEITAQAFIITDCYGLARVDFLVNGKTNEIFLSEINTMPGFTKISMYPKLWEASGLRYSQLLDKLIALARKRHLQKQKLNTTYKPKSSWYSPTIKE